MPKVRSATDIAEKWSRVTPMRSEDYRRGVENPKKDWAQATAAANDRYVQGVTAAAQAGRFAGGVKKAGSQKWATRAAVKGPSRFSEGVAMAAPDYENGFAPFRDVIEKTSLAPRYPKGDPRNFERVKQMGEALHKAKLGQVK